MKHPHYHRYHHTHRHSHSARNLTLLSLAITAAAAVGLLVYSKKRNTQKALPMPGHFKLLSPAFDSDERIPVRYTCQGDNVSPPLEFSGVPSDTQSLALVLHDPDAPNGDYLHWAIWDIHPGITDIPEGAVPLGAVEGRNDFGDQGYGGPCPPSGVHHYEFDAYALDASLKLPAGSERDKVMAAIESHRLAKTTLVGTFGVGA